MKTRLFTVVAIALLLMVLVGSASAQEGVCFGDPSLYQICYLAEYDTQVMFIDSQGFGVEIGAFPGEVYPYAAANLDSNQFMTRINGPEGGAADLYFTGKTPLADGAFMTTWSIIVYDEAGNALGIQEYELRAAPEAVSLPFALAAPMAAPAGDGGTTTATTVNVPTVSYAGDYEPVIVQQGTVRECLVRATYTVRMREAPTVASPVLDTVPFDTAMPSDMVTADGLWVRAFFVGEGGVGNLGWIAVDYVSLSDACEGISQAAPIGNGAAVTVTTTTTTTESGATTTETTVDSNEPFDPTYGGMINLTVVVPGTVESCLVRATYTVRMRVAPSNDVPVLDNVPYRSAMPADMVTSDGAWVRANYLGSLGWIDSDFLSLSDACEGLNAIAPIN